MNGLILMIAAVLTVSNPVAMSRVQEPELVLLARRVRVSSLDSTLPADRTRALAGGQAAVGRSAIRWEVNDCGEGGDSRTAPTCAEAAVDLAANTTAHLSLQVEARNGTRVKPAIYTL